MVRSVFVLNVAVVVFLSGFGSIHSNKEVTDGGGTVESTGDCGTILATVKMSQKQLDKLDDTVRNITLNLRETMALIFFEQLEKIEYIVKSKFDLLDKKMDSKFLQLMNNLESNLVVIQDKISEYTKHIDSKISGLESNLTHALNASASITSTDIIYKPGPSKCDSSQEEECCTAAVVSYREFTDYTEMTSKGRHTVVNMTSGGLQEYTMYFAVRGEYVRLVLSSTSPRTDLYYNIGFIDSRGGNIDMWEHLPTDSSSMDTIVHDIYPTNSISRWRYSYYYVTISGDTLEVGRRGEPPLMTHTSTELRRLKYFSFQWWGGFTTGAALYDCTTE